MQNILAQAKLLQISYLKDQNFALHQNSIVQVYNLSEQAKPLHCLKEIPKPFGLYVSTAKDIALAQQYANFIYIPGELCRQSDLLEEAKQTKVPLIIEKGIFLPPNDIYRLCEKIQGAQYALVECGNSHGYADVSLDPRSLTIMRKNSNYLGISLSDLLAPAGAQYYARPKWLQDHTFLETFIKISKVFELNFLVIKNYGPGKLEQDFILNMLKFI